MRGTRGRPSCCPCVPDGRARWRIGPCPCSHRGRPLSLSASCSCSTGTASVPEDIWPLVVLHMLPTAGILPPRCCTTKQRCVITRPGHKYGCDRWRAAERVNPHLDQDLRDTISFRPLCSLAPTESFRASHLRAHTCGPTPIPMRYRTHQSRSALGNVSGTACKTWPCEFRNRGASVPRISSLLTPSGASSPRWRELPQQCRPPSQLTFCVPYRALRQRAMRVETTCNFVKQSVEDSVSWPPIHNLRDAERLTLDLNCSTRPRDWDRACP